MGNFIPRHASPALFKRLRLARANDSAVIEKRRRFSKITGAQKARNLRNLREKMRVFRAIFGKIRQKMHGSDHT